jgi:hypothetical protein
MKRPIEATAERQEGNQPCGEIAANSTTALIDRIMRWTPAPPARRVGRSAVQLWSRALAVKRREPT